MFGGQGSDWLIGEFGNDFMSGDLDLDFLFSGPGNDTIAGGAGTDFFSIYPDDDRDLILDFEPGVDIVEMSRAMNGVFIPDFQAMLVRTFDGPGGAIVDLGADNTLQFSGVPKSLLRPEGFLFAPD